jgi:hypothetical protein
MISFGGEISSSVSSTGPVFAQRSKVGTILLNTLSQSANRTYFIGDKIIFGGNSIQSWILGTPSDTSIR